MGLDYGGGQLGVGGSMSWTQPNIDKRGGQLRTSVALTTQYAGGLFISIHRSETNGFGERLHNGDHFFCTSQTLPHSTSSKRVLYLFVQDFSGTWRLGSDLF